MKIRVVADVVFLERGDHVRAAALFEHAGFFTHDFECRPDAPARKHVGQPQARVVIRRQQVVLGVEPEDDVDAGSGALPGIRGTEAWKKAREAAANEKRKERAREGGHAPTMHAE